YLYIVFFFFSSRRRHTRFSRDWSSDVCSSDLYEHHDDVQVADNALVIDGTAVDTYTFRQDYYFMMGDNRNNSLDSRYWGFVPEDHIVGKPLFIWLSIDREAGLLEKIRWERMFRRIK